MIESKNRSKNYSYNIAGVKNISNTFLQIEQPNKIYDFNNLISKNVKRSMSHDFINANFIKYKPLNHEQNSKKSNCKIQEL